VSNLPQLVDEGNYQTPPFAPEPNRYISSLRRGTKLYFDAARTEVPNIASELTAEDIETLRAAGHGIVLDPGEPGPEGTVTATESELRRKSDYLAGVVAKAQAEGNMRTYWENEESARMAAGALRDFLARQGSAPTPAAALTQW
jgi:hypothetical protein